jgi:S-adenosylmethionine hydrolase
MDMYPLVFQTDFGLVDGAVSAMYGVAYSVQPQLRIHDLTHDITPFNIWEASYRLIQTINYWPEGTVFVSVVDPGVGSVRKSVVAKTNSGRYIVTPDNGTLTHVIRFEGIAAAREIDENINRLPRSGESYTFHGRDVYAFTGARLAAGIIDFAGVGPELSVDSLVSLPIVEPYLDGNAACGTIDVLDVRFGSLWTNIPRELFLQTGIRYGDRVSITIENEIRCIYRNIILFGRSFADVCVGEALAYINSLDCVAIAINQGSFARAYNIGTGNSWRIRLEPFKGF